MNANFSLILVAAGIMGVFSSVVGIYTIINSSEPVFEVVNCYDSRGNVITDLSCEKDVSLSAPPIKILFFSIFLCVSSFTFGLMNYFAERIRSDY